MPIDNLGFVRESVVEAVVTEKNEIDGDVLLSGMTEEMLSSDLKIRQLGIRIKIWKAIVNAREQQQKVAAEESVQVLSPVGSDRGWDGLDGPMDGVETQFDDNEANIGMKADLPFEDVSSGDEVFGGSRNLSRKRGDKCTTESDSRSKTSKDAHQRKRPQKQRPFSVTSVSSDDGEDEQSVAVNATPEKTAGPYDGGASSNGLRSQPFPAPPVKFITQTTPIVRHPKSPPSLSPQEDEHNTLLQPTTEPATPTPLPISSQSKKRITPTLVSTSQTSVQQPKKRITPTLVSTSEQPKKRITPTLFSSPQQSKKRISPTLISSPQHSKKRITPPLISSRQQSKKRTTPSIIPAANQPNPTDSLITRSTRAEIKPTPRHAPSLHSNPVRDVDVFFGRDLVDDDQNVKEQKEDWAFSRRGRISAARLATSKRNVKPHLADELRKGVDKVLLDNYEPWGSRRYRVIQRKIKRMLSEKNYVELPPQGDSSLSGGPPGQAIAIWTPPLHLYLKQEKTRMLEAAVANQAVTSLGLKRNVWAAIADVPRKVFYENEDGVIFDAVEFIPEFKMFAHPTRPLSSYPLVSPPTPKANLPTQHPQTKRTGEEIPSTTEALAASSSSKIDKEPEGRGIITLNVDMSQWWAVRLVPTVDTDSADAGANILSETKTENQIPHDNDGDVSMEDVDEAVTSETSHLGPNATSTPFSVLTKKKAVDAAVAEAHALEEENQFMKRASKLPTVVRAGYVPVVIGGYKCTQSKEGEESDEGREEDIDPILPPYGESDAEWYETDSEWERDLREMDRQEAKRKEAEEARVGNEQATPKKTRGKGKNVAGVKNEVGKDTDREFGGGEGDGGEDNPDLMSNEMDEDEDQDDDDQDLALHELSDGEVPTSQLLARKSTRGPPGFSSRCQALITTSGGVQSIVDAFIKETTEHWERTKLPKLEGVPLPTEDKYDTNQDARAGETTSPVTTSWVKYRIWRDKRRYLPDMKQEIEDLETRRLKGMIEAIHNSVRASSSNPFAKKESGGSAVGLLENGISERAVKALCKGLEETIVFLCELKWKVRVCEGAPVPKPPRRVRVVKTPDTEAKVDKVETEDKADEGDDGDDADDEEDLDGEEDDDEEEDDMDDFIATDDDEAVLLAEMEFNDRIRFRKAGEDDRRRMLSKKVRRTTRRRKGKARSKKAGERVADKAGGADKEIEGAVDLPAPADDAAIEFENPHAGFGDDVEGLVPDMLPTAEAEATSPIATGKEEAQAQDGREASIDEGKCKMTAVSDARQLQGLGLEDDEDDDVIFGIDMAHISSQAQSSSGIRRWSSATMSGAQSGLNSTLVGEGESDGRKNDGAAKSAKSGSIDIEGTRSSPSREASKATTAQRSTREQSLGDSTKRPVNVTTTAVTDVIVLDSSEDEGDGPVRNENLRVSAAPDSVKQEPLEPQIDSNPTVEDILRRVSPRLAAKRNRSSLTPDQDVESADKAHTAGKDVGRESSVPTTEPSRPGEDVEMAAPFSEPSAAQANGPSHRWQTPSKVRVTLKKGKNKQRFDTFGQQQDADMSEDGNQTPDLPGSPSAGTKVRGSKKKIPRDEPPDDPHGEKKGNFDEKVDGMMKHAPMNQASTYKKIFDSQLKLLSLGVTQADPHIRQVLIEQIKFVEQVRQYKQQPAFMGDFDAMDDEEQDANCEWDANVDMLDIGQNGHEADIDDFLVWRAREVERLENEDAGDQPGPSGMKRKSLAESHDEEDDDSDGPISFPKQRKVRRILSDGDEEEEEEEVEGEGVALPITPRSVDKNSSGVSENWKGDEGASKSAKARKKRSLSSSDDEHNKRTKKMLKEDDESDPDLVVISTTPARGHRARRDSDYRTTDDGVILVDSDSETDNRTAKLSSPSQQQQSQIGKVFRPDSSNAHEAEGGAESTTSGSSRKRRSRRSSLESDSEDMKDRDASSSNAGSPKKARKPPGRRNIKKIMPEAPQTKSLQQSIVRQQREILERNERAKLESIGKTRKTVIINAGHAEGEKDIFVPYKLAEKLKEHQASALRYEPTISSDEIEGIQFMWRNLIMIKQYRNDDLEPRHVGCILAHSMGLGKTLQVITFVYTLMYEVERKNKSIPEHLRANKTLILMPTGLVLNWSEEFKKWIKDDPGCKIFHLEGFRTDKNRLEILELWKTQKGVLLLSYDMLRSLTTRNVKKNAQKNATTADATTTNEANPMWASGNMGDSFLRSSAAGIGDERYQDGSSSNGNGAAGQPTEEDPSDTILEQYKKYLLEEPSLVICDEGHIVKNKNAIITGIVNSIRTPSRICLTGTPLQNNLEEYWTMIDFVCPGFLGKLSEFRNQYIRPIENGGYRDSTKADIKTMIRQLAVLTRKMEPIVLRRDNRILKKDLPEKREFLLTCRLTAMQHKAYRFYLSTLDDTKGKILREFHRLMCICNHPYTTEINRDLALRSPKKPALNAPQPSIDNDDGIADGEQVVEAIEDTIGFEPKEDNPEDPRIGSLVEIVKTAPDRKAPELSSKLLILLEIVRACLKLKEKVLIFTRSIPMFEFTSENLDRLNIKHSKIRGGVPTAVRNKLIHNFNESPDVPVFLITSNSGSLGVNLPAATRVVLCDVGWNPTVDMQAVARAYRYGQTRKTFVYRLCTFDTYEDKIMNRNVQKEGLAREVVDKANIHKIFSKKDLSEYFKVPDENPESQLADDQTFEDPVLMEVIRRHRELLVNIQPYEELIKEEENLLDEEDKEFTDKQIWFEQQQARFSTSKPVFEPLPSQIPLAYGPVTPPDVTPSEGSLPSGLMPLMASASDIPAIPTNDGIGPSTSGSGSSAPVVPTQTYVGETATMSHTPGTIESTSKQQHGTNTSNKKSPPFSFDGDESNSDGRASASGSSGSTPPNNGITMSVDANTLGASSTTTLQNDDLVGLQRQTGSKKSPPFSFDTEEMDVDGDVSIGGEGFIDADAMEEYVPKSQLAILGTEFQMAPSEQ
ncbi:hypothetical protein HK102_002186 [Quaeritorhiza haematococci]|nr:hypothetical protein HK102_002186 [Quaeritorhiza haematococci]